MHEGKGDGDGLGEILDACSLLRNGRLGSLTIRCHPSFMVVLQSPWAHRGSRATASMDVDLPGTAAEGPPEVLGTLEPSLEFKVPCQKPVLLDCSTRVRSTVLAN